MGKMRMIVPLLFLLQACLFVGCCHGFAATRSGQQQGGWVPNSKIPSNLEKDVAPKVFSRRLNFRVAVGSKENPFQMKDMILQLGDSKRISKRFSTGIYEANLLSNPYYINDKGQQDVALRQGGWEVTWKENSPHGHLTCSFISPDRVQRTNNNNNNNNREEGEGSGATLESGRFFLNHRVWTTETLEIERERRRQIQSEAAKFIDDRDKKIQTYMDDKENFGSKVLSYAQAAKSMNSYRNSGYQEALYIPLYDEQVLQLAPNLILSTRGEVFQVLDDGGPYPQRIGDSRVDDCPNTYLKTRRRTT